MWLWGKCFLSTYIVFWRTSYTVLILIASVSLHVSFVFVMLWKTFTHNRPNALRNRSIFFSLFEFVTHKKSEVYKQRSRICLSCLKKGMFLPLERPLLDCIKASSSSMRGVSSKREGRSCWNLLTFSFRLVSVSSLTEDNSFFHRGHFFFSRKTVLFLAEGSFFSHRTHRRTEYTSFHRDIKSTDITVPYSQHPSPNTHQKPHPQPLSEWRGEWSPRYPYISSVC